MTNSKIFFHADDFGVTLEQSKNILDCHQNGVLNSVSIIPNSPQAAESYRLIKELVENNKIRLVIHLNFVEGHCLAEKDKLNHLVDNDGNFTCSYGSMLKLNFSGKHNIVKEEFKLEIAAQIDAITKITGTKTINVDSHQHYLQIPMIFEAFCEVVKENNYNVEYLRIPVDPVAPIMTTPSCFFKVPVINHVKWLLLRFLRPSKSKIASLNCKVPVFFGMPFTCQMTIDKVEKLLPKYLKIAEKHNNSLELMFHPGAVNEIEQLLDATQADLVEFYGSNYRTEEFNCLHELNK